MTWELNCPSCNATQGPTRSHPDEPYVCSVCGAPWPTLEERGAIRPKTSNGSTASYYQLPAGASELQDLISYRNMNAQLGEIFRAAYRYGQASHSNCLRDARKIKFYAEAEIARLEKYGKSK